VFTYHVGEVSARNAEVYKETGGQVWWLILRRFQ